MSQDIEDRFLKVSWPTGAAAELEQLTGAQVLAELDSEPPRDLA